MMSLRSFLLPENKHMVSVRDEVKEQVQKLVNEGTADILDAIAKDWRRDPSLDRARKKLEVLADRLRGKI